MLRLAIDTGGTFTDCVLHDAASGELWFGKTLSTPRAPQQAVLAGIERLQAARRFELTQLDAILLATTVATNALLERTGACLGLVTTRGFRDVAIVQRAKRYDTYDLHLDKPRPLVRRRAIVEVDERTGARGDVVSPLDPASVDAAVAELERQAVEAVAVVLLHSYANPAHEQAVARRLRELHPEWTVSVSSEVSPKYREYERTSTTLANAYITPVVNRFLDRLSAAFEAQGFGGSLYVMQSNGGLLTPALARAYPVNIIESGPAAGVLLGGVIGKREAVERVLTFDMGGTTAKVGALENGEPAVTSTFEVDGINLRQWSGLPLNISAVELIEIGAGGGSIARADMGVIAVGPQSAGADPGPVCYGRGGRAATVTDANLVLGYLTPDRFAGGAMRLDLDAARAAVRTQVAEPLGLDVYEAAWGVHALANASMERAMRSMSIERGRDPRDFAMVAFGGAGPLHACRLARSLGVRQVIVPWGAGVGSAVGMLEAEPRLEATLTRVLAVVPAAIGPIGELFADLERRVRAAVGDDPVSGWLRHVYLRYAGQGYELRVAAPSGPIDSSFVPALVRRFHDAYAQAYGYAERAQAVEATDWQVTAVLRGGVGLDGAGSIRPPKLEGVQPGCPEPASQVAYFPEAGSPSLSECPIYARGALPAGPVAGPAIIADAEATTLVPPGDEAVLNRAGDLVITVAAEETL